MVSYTRLVSFHSTSWYGTKSYFQLHSASEKLPLFVLVTSAKLLGVTISHDLKWNMHTSEPGVPDGAARQNTRSTGRI